MLERLDGHGIPTRKTNAACPASVSGETWSVATYHCARPLATEKTTKATMEATRRGSMSGSATTPRTAVAMLTVRGDHRREQRNLLPPDGVHAGDDCRSRSESHD